jgi:hypothetical protein
MKKRTGKSGIAVALAWPETWCKQAGAWYEPITKWAGFNVNHYYRAGHAALVLVDIDKLTCHYFDFGRYHAPFQHGRVRGALTDYDLQIYTKPIISGDGLLLENFGELLNELQNNPACHGEGTLYASYMPVDFEKAHKKALQMQKAGPVPYGPFRYKGSNCSRFVNTVIRSGKPGFWTGFKLNFFVPLTPTPMNNVNALKHIESVASHPALIPFDPLQQKVKPYLKTILPPPPKHPDVPVEAVWLSGEGAGSWFSLEHCSESIISARYSPGGRLECIGMFQNKGYHSDIHPNDFTLTYPSDCQKITLQSGNKTIKMHRIPDKELICRLPGFGIPKTGGDLLQDITVRFSEIF